MFRLAFECLKETHFATRLDRWVTGMIVVLLVAFGFLLGRWTSLTNTAVPIIFQEAPGVKSSAASADELRALVTGTPAPALEQATVKGQTSAPGRFVASVNGKKYYRPSCPEVRRIKEENKVWFDSETEAKETGYEPSSCVRGKKP